MVSVSESIWIDSPVETAFEYLDDPYNHAEVTPSVTNVQNVDRLENGGKRLDCTYTMAGDRLENQTRTDGSRTEQADGLRYAQWH